MDTAPKTDISSRLERIRARRAQQVASAAHNTSTGFERSPISINPTAEIRNIETDKASPPRDFSLSVTGLTSNDTNSPSTTKSNPITTDKLTSRLELIKKKRSRENIHMIDEPEVIEPGHKKEQSNDTVDSGIGTTVLPAKIDNKLETVLPKIPSQQYKTEVKPSAPISTPPRIHKVSFAPPAPEMFSQQSDKPTSLQEEVLAELGLTDIPPTIPDSSPPATPIDPNEDKFKLETSPTAESHPQEVSRETEAEKRYSSVSVDKSPAFMLMNPRKLSPKKSSPIRTLTSTADGTGVTPRQTDRDETYSVSLSQTTTTGLLDWDVENVIDWLHFIQLQHLVAIFRDRAITGAKLNNITQKELQFMGVVSSEEQQTILHEVAELRMLWQVDSESGSQLMFDDITAGLANMSVRRKDLEKELDSHVTERLNKLEEIKNEQDDRINTSITLLKEIQNPYPPDPPTDKPPEIDISTIPIEEVVVIEEDRKMLSEGLEDLAEQSLISGSSHDTEVDPDQMKPVQEGQNSNLQGPIRPPTIFRTDTPLESTVPSLPSNPEKWTPSDICQWLSSLPLSQFTPLIQNNRIDGKQLISRDFITNKEFLRFSPTEQELLLSYLQDLSPTPSTSNSIPSDPHSRQSSRAYSERVTSPPRPMKETRSASDTGLLDHVVETAGKEKQGKKGFFRKFIPKKFSTEKLDKGESNLEIFPKSCSSSEGELSNIRTAKKLAGFFGVEAQSPAIQSIFHGRDSEGQGLLRIYVSHVLPDATYKAVLVHPKDNCLQVLRLVMQKGGLQREDINRFTLIESCPSNPRIPEKELGLHEYPLIIHMRHLDMPEPFTFELRTRPSTSLQFVINVPDKVINHTLRIQIAPVTTARECITLFKGRIPELNDPILKLVVEAEKENGELTRLRPHDAPVILQSDWAVRGEQVLFSISREAPVANEQRTTREFLDEIQDLQSAVQSYHVVEQKYTSLQEEHQRLLRKSRDSMNSARDISTIDQLQELDLKYQNKVQLCRNQKDELKKLKSRNEELLSKLTYIKSDTEDIEFTGDTQLTHIKQKLTEKRKDILISDDVQSLTEENIYLKDELRKKQLILEELEATGNKMSPNGVVLYELASEHPDYAFVRAHLDINKTGPALGISIGKRNEPGTFVMKIIPDSVADKDGSLRIGDRLIEVNGIDISHTEHSAIVKLFKSLTTSVKIVVARKTERDQLAQQKLTQKIASYENLKERYVTLEVKIEEIEKLQSQFSEKESEISELKRQLQSKLILDENERSALETEYAYTRGYLDHVITILETEAPHILQKLPQEFDPIPGSSDEPTNDEEWC
ncbi:Multiple PDZ domain protein-like [Oopsacas minuta]|uniref:Multiple PDZ domain protein-like n=1 Tax=Oopsacas minuta TaxID=111878 RepID=A0AAV7JEM0_9METZ|nr:Multiple PDZ domain protein-like [Oopsacas minuta]